MKITLQQNGTALVGDRWNSLNKIVEDETSKMVKMIEEEYGQMDSSYQTLVINFNSAGERVTYFDNVKKTLIIHLPEYCMKSEELYGLRHGLTQELVHCITPGGDSSKVSALEEGMTIFLAEKYVGRWGTTSGRYNAARDMVAKLINLDPEIIKKIRKKHVGKRLSEFTAEDIMDEIQLVSEQLCKNVTQLFYSLPDTSS